MNRATSALIAAAESHITVLGCISLLSEMQRRVVELRLLEQQSGDDVASRLGLSTNNVAVMLHRAKANLRLCING